MSQFSNWTKESVLKLSMYKGLTYSTQKRVIESYSSFEHLLSEPPEWLSSKLNPNTIFDNNSNVERRFEDNIESMERNGVEFVCYLDEEYPKNLKLIEQSPTVLYYKGTLMKEAADCISIVGTRKCSVYGRLSTERICSELASQGIIIVSGLAYGIDAIAHQTTNKSGGKTYAVIASGIDEISPSTAEKLADEIIECGGAIISEYQCGIKARPGYFPQRNRIISGISLATVVIESDVKGGSLITARFAVDQSREVFAVPGPISSAKSAGCNKLIHDNIAIAALSARSILTDLGLSEEIKFAEEKPKLTFATEADRLLYDALSHEPMQVDVLAEITNMEISEVLVKLLEFEFKGWVRQLPGKYYVIN